MERQLLRYLTSGDSFFTEKDDRYITAVAGQEGVKVKTQRYTALDKESNKKLVYLTKVIIL